MQFALMIYHTPEEFDMRKNDYDHPQTEAILARLIPRMTGQPEIECAGLIVSPITSGLPTIHALARLLVTRVFLGYCSAGSRSDASSSPS